MTVDLKKILILNLPYLLFVYLFDKLCQAVRLAPGLDASEKLLHLSQGFTEAFSSGLPSLHPLDLLVGIAGAVIVRLAVYAKSKNTKKYRKGITTIHNTSNGNYKGKICKEKRRNHHRLRRSNIHQKINLFRFQLPPLLLR